MKVSLHVLHGFSRPGSITSSANLFYLFFFFANNCGFYNVWDANVQANVPKCASLPATGEAQKREYWWMPNLGGLGLYIINIPHV